MEAKNCFQHNHSHRLQKLGDFPKHFDQTFAQKLLNFQFIKILKLRAKMSNSNVASPKISEARPYAIAL